VPDIDFGTIPREMSLDAKIYLGRKLADGREIQTDDALIWAVSSPVAWRKRWPNDQKDVFQHSGGIASYPAFRRAPRSSAKRKDQCGL